MMEKETLQSKFFEFLHKKFDLSEDNAQEEEVVENVKKSVEFKGTNLWVLIFATYIASIGLNVNSAAVIIGAMLISPLMGPIMGIGLAVGINDFELLKRSARNFGFAVLISLIVSTIYFLMSPLTVAGPELLARTQPSTWDVLIAFFGGLAGIVAQSRRDKTSTVIPGVAIATALMPPLCTAGFGLATMNMEYFGGALYLFFINTIFISLATYAIVRFMKYKKKVFVDPARERKIKRVMGLIAVVVIVPSVLLAVNIVNKTVFETNVKRYVEKSFVFKDTQVIDTKSSYSQNEQSIEVTLIGRVVSDETLEALRGQLSSYGLRDAELVVKQQAVGDTTLVSTTIKSLDKLYSISQNIIAEKDGEIKILKEEIDQFSGSRIPVQEIVKEFGAISGFKDVSISISKAPSYDSDGVVRDTIVTCYVKLASSDLTLTEENNNLIVNWLKVRTASKNVKLIVE